PAARLAARRRCDRRRNPHQRPTSAAALRSASALAVFLWLWCVFLGCGSPPATYATIEKEVDGGDFTSALGHVNRALASDPTPVRESHWRIRILKARILVSQTNFVEALALLGDELPRSLADTDLPEQRHLYRGIAHHYARQFTEAENDFRKAEAIAGRLAPR